MKVTHKWPTYEQLLCIMTLFMIYSSFLWNTPTCPSLHLNLSNSITFDLWTMDTHSHSNLPKPSRYASVPFCGTNLVILPQRFWKLLWAQCWWRRTDIRIAFLEVPSSGWGDTDKCTDMWLHIMWPLFISHDRDRDACISCDHCLYHMTCMMTTHLTRSWPGSASQRDRWWRWIRWPCSPSHTHWSSRPGRSERSAGASRYLGWG